MTENDLVVLSRCREWSADGTAKRIRLAAGLSQPELAASCGVHHSSISNWESGRRTPQRAGGLAYARILAVLAKSTAAASAVTS